MNLDGISDILFSSSIITKSTNCKLIEKKRPRRRKPGLNHKRSSSRLRPFDNRTLNVPRTRVAISKALEKYNNLAQDAFSNGDRIVAEGYYQYAEHYQRVLNETADDGNNNESANKNNSFNRNKFQDRPSRTQRAIEAKNNKDEKPINDEKNGSLGSTKGQNDNTYTSDGIEALKPFEI